MKASEALEYVEPTPEKKAWYEECRRRFIDLAKFLEVSLTHTDPAVLRLLEAHMWANKSVALHGLSDELPHAEATLQKYDTHGWRVPVVVAKCPDCGINVHYSDDLGEAEWHTCAFCGTRYLVTRA